jgi:hypothetical protein
MFNDLYSLPNIVRVIKLRRMRWVGHVACMGGEKSCIQGDLVGKPKGKKPLGRSSHRWEDNIQMDLQEVEWGGMDWIDLDEDRERWQAFVNMVMHLLVS